MLVSITRLRLRSVWYLFPFMIWARRSNAQALRSPGCVKVLSRKTRGMAFWTLSLWENEGSLRGFMTQAPHRKAMPKLYGWCDEAAIGRWQTDSRELPGWKDAEQRLATVGRLARVKWPSELQGKEIINLA